MTSWKSKLRGDGLFVPDDFGDGNDPRSVQAAIDAAGIVGGSRVRLLQDCALETMGKQDYGPYAGIHYGLSCPYPNVTIEGPGRLVLERLPDTDNGSFTMLAVGTGEDYTTNVGLEGVTFDCSALTEQERGDLWGLLSSCVLFARCEGFTIRDNTFNAGLKDPLNVHLSSRGGVIENNTVGGSLRCGLWLDGTQLTRVVGNKIYGNLWGAGPLEGVGISLLANTDLYTNADRMIIESNWLYDCRTRFITTIGTRCVIRNNVCDGVTATRVGILTTYTSNAHGDFPSGDTVIEGNILRHVVPNIAAGIAIRVAGCDSGYSGDSVRQERIVIADNHIGATWATSVELGEQTEAWVRGYLPGELVVNETAVVLE